jgi:hypothetical protein
LLFCSESSSANFCDQLWEKLWSQDIWVHWEVAWAHHSRPCEHLRHSCWVREMCAIFPIQQRMGLRKTMKTSAMVWMRIPQRSMF